MGYKQFSSFAAVFLSASLIASCTTTHSVRTVGKGNVGAEASLGGPMLLNLGPPIPMPNLFVGARYGVRDDMDISAAYNLTAPITPGLALDLVLAERWVPIQPGLRSQTTSPTRGWSLATGVEAHLLSDFQTGFRFIPAFDVAAGWRHEWFNPFVGFSLGLNLNRPFDEVHVPMLSPFLGTDIIINQKAALSFRLTFFDITYNYYRSQVEWVYLSNKGVGNDKHAIVGVSLGFSFDWIKGGASTEKAGGDQ